MSKRHGPVWKTNPLKSAYNAIQSENRACFKKDSVKEKISQTTFDVEPSKTTEKTIDDFNNRFDTKIKSIIQLIVACTIIFVICLMAIAAFHHTWTTGDDSGFLELGNSAIFLWLVRIYSPIQKR
jgi:hypothetical protein